MSLELTVCNDWRPEPLLSPTARVKGELEEQRMDGCALREQVSEFTAWAHLDALRCRPVTIIVIFDIQQTSAVASVSWEALD